MAVTCWQTVGITSTGQRASLTKIHSVKVPLKEVYVV